MAMTRNFVAPSASEMGRADIFIQREAVSRNGSYRGRPHAAGSTRGRRHDVASNPADGMGRYPGRRTRAVGSRQVGSPFPQEARTVHGGGPDGAGERGGPGPRVPRGPEPPGERVPYAG